MASNKNINMVSEWLYDDAGNKTGVKIKFKDFENLIKKLEDLHDLHSAYQHKGKKLKTIPFEQAVKEALDKNAKK